MGEEQKQRSGHFAFAIIEEQIQTNHAMALMRTLVILLCLSFIPWARAQNAKPVEEQEVADWLNKKYDCPPEPPVHFWTFEYFDFTGDGSQQAIVVASTCETGTGGPDVHFVLARDSDGELEELKIDEPAQKAYDNLFGNRNLDVSGGLMPFSVAILLSAGRQSDKSGAGTFRIGPGARRAVAAGVSLPDCGGSARLRRHHSRDNEIGSSAPLS